MAMVDGWCDRKRSRIRHVVPGQILPRFSTESRVSRVFLRGRFLDGPVRMPSRIISERAFQFAVRIVKLCRKLWVADHASRKLADQLFDSGTSIGANAAESQGGQTKADVLGGSRSLGRKAGRRSTGCASPLRRR